MKRFLLIALLAALVICSCSCVEEIEADTIPALGPMASATSPKAPEPLPVIDPDTVPDTTDPSESDPNGNDEPVVTTLVLDNGATSEGKAVTNTLSGYISNSESSETGEIVNKYTSGNTTVYSVPYARTFSFIVEVTTYGENIKVEAYLEHYALFMGHEKPITVTIGDMTDTVLTAEVEWEDNVSARTLLVSAVAPKGEGDTVDIEVSMPYGGTYHKKDIETLSLSVTHPIN